jgi:hypothetical protein
MAKTNNLILTRTVFINNEYVMLTFIFALFPLSYFTTLVVVVATYRYSAL